ncbi:MAG: M20/M25/M40 family metallo-hydrolase [Candidatus Margulisiibacteriota bacterium]
MINKRRLIGTFKKLVRTDSLSLKEGKVVGFLQKELRALRLRYYEAGRVRGGEVGNLIVEIPGREIKKPRILLNAHLDTVSPGKKIKPIERRGYITSTGMTVLGADNKAGVAVILEILRILKEKKLPHPPIRVIFTVAEEIGLLGAKALPERLFLADFGITLDGGDVDAIIYKAPSQYNLVATVFGRAAHAGIHPEEGINAIKVASIAISKMKLGRIDKETTSNIGLIKGGKATNIIPDEVELKGEARSHNFKKLKRQVEHMEKILLNTSSKFKARLKLKVEQVYRSFEIKKGERILRLAMAAAKKTGLKPVLKQTGGGSDANIFNAAGIPTVIMGVGADRVHTTSERIAIQDMIMGAESILNLLEVASS